MSEQGFLYDFLKVLQLKRRWPWPLTFTLTLTLKNDASHMYLSLHYVSSTGIDPFFLYEFSKLRNDLDLWPWPWHWPCKTIPLIYIYHYIKYHQQWLNRAFYMIFLNFATNTQMTLTFDLDLDTDLAKRCLSYVSIIILKIINRDWPVLFIWIFKVSEQIWPLWPWPSRYHKNKKPVWQIFPLPTYQVLFKYLQPFLRNRCVTPARTAARTVARTHGRTRVKIISCHSFAWQLNNCFWGEDN
jgi:hypothetical protein